MSDNTINTEMKQGVQYLDTITIKDPGVLTSQQLRDLTETQAIALSGIDLTLATITATLREQFDDITPLAVFTIVNDDLVNGIFSIALSDTQTQALDFDTGKYDVTIDYGSGDVRGVLEGEIKFIRTVDY